MASPRSPFRETTGASPNHQRQNNSQSFFPTDTPWLLDPEHHHSESQQATMTTTTTNSNANDDNDCREEPASTDEAAVVEHAVSNDENSFVRASYSYSPTKRPQPQPSSSVTPTAHVSDFYSSSDGKSKSMDASMIAAMRHHCTLADNYLAASGTTTPPTAAAVQAKEDVKEDAPEWQQQPVVVDQSFTHAVPLMEDEVTVTPAKAASAIQDLSSIFSADSPFDGLDTSVEQESMDAVQRPSATTHVSTQDPQPILQVETVTSQDSDDVVVVVQEDSPLDITNPFDQALNLQEASLLSSESINESSSELEEEGIPAAPTVLKKEMKQRSSSFESETEPPTETASSSDSSSEEEDLEEDATRATFSSAPTVQCSNQQPIVLSDTFSAAPTVQCSNQTNSGCKDDESTTLSEILDAPDEPVVAPIKEEDYLQEETTTTTTTAICTTPPRRKSQLLHLDECPLTPVTPKDRYLLAVRQAAAKCKTMVSTPREIVTGPNLTPKSSVKAQIKRHEAQQEHGLMDGLYHATNLRSRDSFDDDSLYYDHSSDRNDEGITISPSKSIRFISASPTVASILMEAVAAAQEHTNTEEQHPEEFGSPMFDEDGSPTKSSYDHDESTDGLPVKEQIDIGSETSPTRSYLQLDLEASSSDPTELAEVDEEVEPTNNHDINKGNALGPMDALRTSLAMIWNSKPRPRAENEQPKRASSEKYAQVVSPREIVATESSKLDVDAFCQVPDDSGERAMESLRSSLKMIWNSKPRPKQTSTPAKNNKTALTDKASPQSSTKLIDLESQKGRAAYDSRNDSQDCKRGRVLSEDSDAASSYRKVPHKKTRCNEGLSGVRGRSTSREGKLPMGSQYLTSERGRKLSRDRTITPVPSNEEEPYLGCLLGAGNGSYDSTEDFQNQARCGPDFYPRISRSGAGPTPLKPVETSDTEDSFIDAALKARDMNDVVIVYSGTPDKRDWHPPEQESKEHDTMVRAILERPSLIDKSNPEPHQPKHWEWSQVRKWTLVFLAMLVFVATISGCLACGITGKCVSRSEDTPQEVETVKPLVLDLPDYTLEALQSLHSAQTKAYLWLEDDPNRDSYSESRMLQRFALATLYHSTKIAQNWTVSTSWLSYDIHECYWFSSYEGVDVCEEEELKHLVLKKNNLRGNLPPELALLSSLVEIDLSRNVLISAIPTQLGHLTSLESLWLEKNELNGAIPTQLSAMTSLTNLALATNDLKGTLPPELGSLTNLKKMRVFYNFFTGELPSELGLLTNLELLDVDVNNLSGHIPSELGKLEKLEELWLDWNSFVGPIPTQLGLLKNLIKLYLGRAFVEDVLRDDGWKGSGDYIVPSELGQLTSLRELYLDNNNLTGMIPTELSSLTDLERMTLDNNLLTDSISPGICSLFGGELESLSVDCSEVFCNCGCTCV